MTDSRAVDLPSPQGTPRPVAFVCPYCGGTTSDAPRCDQCRGPVDPLSRQATQNTMGPWFIRDEAQPFRPGCSFATLVALIHRSKIGSDAILRGPSTNQFWTPARRVPGIAHLFETCHNCQESVSPSATQCPACGVSFLVRDDRQTLGLLAVRAIPGQTLPDAPPAAPEIAPAPGADLASANRPSAATLPMDKADRDRLLYRAEAADARARSLRSLVIFLSVVLLAAAGGAFALLAAGVIRVDSAATALPAPSPKSTSADTPTPTTKEPAPTEPPSEGSTNAPAAPPATSTPAPTPLPSPAAPAEPAPKSDLAAEIDAIKPLLASDKPTSVQEALKRLEALKPVTDAETKLVKALKDQATQRLSLLKLRGS